MRIFTLDPRRRRGQALIMVTFSLFTLVGMMALATDLGLAYFNVKSARTAADAAAMAAAQEVLSTIGNSTPVCGATCVCQQAAPCPASIPVPPTTNIEAGCLYAGQAGFVTGGKDGSQVVTASANTGGPPPTAAGVNDVFYWVTYTVRDTSPRLFSAIFGRGENAISVRSTAAITNGIMSGSLFLLNRRNDNTPVGVGRALAAGGNPTIRLPDGILIASDREGAGFLQGTPIVEAPFTYIRGDGTASIGGNASWTEPPQNGFPDGQRFQDPMGGKGQPPPVPAGGLPNHVPVPDGCLNCLPQPLMPGQYYAVDGNGNATGRLLTGVGNVTFSDGGTGFGNYVFYGGLKFSTPTTARFAAGRYVLAGTLSGNDIMSYATGVNLIDNSIPGQQNTDAGELFVFTNTEYPGLEPHIPAAVRPIASRLGFGKINLHAGNNVDVSVGLHGLNRHSPNLPAELKEFAPTVFWQDQQNSRVKHDEDGNIDTSCSGGDLDNPCVNHALANSDIPEFKLQAHPNVNLYGLIYQPRGAWMTFQGNGGISSSMIIVTGALNMQGGADIRSLDDSDLLSRRMVALVE